MTDPTPPSTVSGAWLPADAVLAACARYRTRRLADATARRAAFIADLSRPVWWAPWRDTSTEAVLRRAGPVPEWGHVLAGGDYDAWTCERLQALAVAAQAARRPVWVVALDVAALAGCWLPRS